jgi:flagellar export protein FliJ
VPRKHLFRYATVLRVRKIQEELEAARLQRIRAAINEASGERNALTREQARMFFEAARTAREQFDASDVQRYYGHERVIQRRLVDTDAEIAQLRQEENRQRGELETATRGRRIVDRLRERHEERVRIETRGMDQKRTDESATSQAAQKRAGGRKP